MILSCIFGSIMPPNGMIRSFLSRGITTLTCVKLKLGIIISKSITANGGMKSIQMHVTFIQQNSKLWNHISCFKFFVFIVCKFWNSCSFLLSSSIRLITAMIGDESSVIADVLWNKQSIDINAIYNLFTHDTKFDINFLHEPTWRTQKEKPVRVSQRTVRKRMLKTKSLPAALILIWFNADQILNNPVPIDQFSCDTAVFLMAHCILLSTLNWFLRGWSAREGLGSPFVTLKAVVHVRKSFWWAMDCQTSKAIFKVVNVKLLFHCHLIVSLRSQAIYQN